MVDADVVTAKLVELSDRVERVRKHRLAEPAALAADRDALDLVSFNLMLAVQAALDIASHIIADEGFAPATTFAEAFARLADRGLLETKTASQLGKAAGLRNVVAHGYAGVDVGMVFTAATTGLADFEAFAQQIAAWLRQQATP